MKDKNAQIIEVRNLILSFAKEKLTKEEEDICLHILEKLGRKQKIDLITRAKANILAAAIIWCFSRANFKYEKGITKDLLANFFNVNKHSFGTKAGEISKLLKIDFFNPEYTTKEIQKQNPLNKYVMTKSGFIIPKDFLKNEK